MKSLFGRIKALNKIADRRTTEVSGVGLFRYIAIMESATVCFGCSEQKFVRRVSIGLTNDNAADKIRDG